MKQRKIHWSFFWSTLALLLHWHIPQIINEDLSLSLPLSLYVSNLKFWNICWSAIQWERREVWKASPEEKVGVMAKKGGLPSVVEYSGAGVVDFGGKDVNGAFRVWRYPESFFGGKHLTGELDDARKNQRDAAGRLVFGVLTLRVLGHTWDYRNQRKAVSVFCCTCLSIS